MRKLKHPMHVSCLKGHLVLLTLVLGLNFAGHSQNERVRIKNSEKTIEVSISGRPVLTYNKVPTEEAPNHEPHFKRSGYIHPLYSPSGKVVTGDFPEDHKHQHALFFAWTKTKFENRKPEFWNQKLEAGKISFVGVVEGSVVSAKGKGGFAVEHLWEDLTASDGPVPVLKETWKVTVFDVGRDRHVFEIESVQEVIGEKPLTIEKYHYGGMAFRGPDSWFVDDKKAPPPSVILTSDGLARIEGNHTRPSWVAMSGPVEGGNAGVAVLSDRRNFRFPQWVRLHPTKPYFVYSPMVEEAFQIRAGEPYVSRFRYVVYDGETDSQMMEREGSKMIDEFWEGHDLANSRWKFTHLATGKVSTVEFSDTKIEVQPDLLDYGLPFTNGAKFERLDGTIYDVSSVIVKTRGGKVESIDKLISLQHYEHGGRLYLQTTADDDFLMEPLVVE